LSTGERDERADKQQDTQMLPDAGIQPRMDGL
jgi:hypothetical protein